MLPHIHSVSQDLIFRFFSRIFYFRGGGRLWMVGGGGKAKIDIKLFSLHFCIEAAKPPVETKKKQDISSFHSYSLFLSFDLTLPSLLTRSLYTLICVPFLTTRTTRQPELWSKWRKNKSYHSSTHTQCSQLRLDFLICSRILLGWGALNVGGGFFYGSSQTSGRNEEKTRYIILPHICSVSQLMPYLAFYASWVFLYS
jgi:hypothetical protein